MKVRLYLLILLILLPFICTPAQEKIFDEQTKHLLDSLSNRIDYLESYIKKKGGQRDAGFFRSKRDLEMTLFLKQYEEYVYDEDLIAPQRLIESKIKESEKRSDNFAIDYYKGYQKKLAKLREHKRRHYQQLFSKEKNFDKEFKTYSKPMDEYSLKRTARMVDLAIKYAEERKRQKVLDYLYKYRKLADAMLLDQQSPYNLKKLTNSSKKFNKSFEPLIEDDSLHVIQEGMQLAEQCYNYANNVNCKLGPNYFRLQKIAAANAIADWNKRQGITAELESLTGQAIIASLDSVNREGIYQWNDMILVIGSVEFSSKSEMVRRGEAIIDADKVILNYIRVNKISKVKNTQIGKTYMVPFVIGNQKEYYLFDSTKRKWQYMICYSKVINEKITEEVSRFLPPLQFREEISN